MIIKQKTDIVSKLPKGNLIVTSDDKIGRADARLVSLISRINRTLKGKGIDSLYHSEDVYKQDSTVLKFDWEDRDTVAKIIRMNNFAVEVDE